MRVRPAHFAGSAFMGATWLHRMHEKPAAPLIAAAGERAFG